jgi:hypothetical protein
VGVALVWNAERETEAARLARETARRVFGLEAPRA